MKSRGVSLPNGGLVLDVKIGEKVVVDNDITVTLIETRAGGKVKLHFDAPSDVPVDRLRVWQRKNPGFIQPGAKGAADASGQ